MTTVAEGQLSGNKACLTTAMENVELLALMVDGLVFLSTKSWLHCRLPGYRLQLRVWSEYDGGWRNSFRGFYRLQTRSRRTPGKNEAHRKVEKLIFNLVLEAVARHQRQKRNSRPRSYSAVTA